jgi:hypothetical protein
MWTFAKLYFKNTLNSIHEFSHLWFSIRCESVIWHNCFVLPIFCFIVIQLVSFYFKWKLAGIIRKNKKYCYCFMHSILILKMHIIIRSQNICGYCYITFHMITFLYATSFMLVHCSYLVFTLATQLQCICRRF